MGAEGGNGVIIARDRQGNWGYPAFYTLASASWGLQFGAQKAGVVLIIRNRGAIESILQNQGKFGADASVAFGPVGDYLESRVYEEGAPASFDFVRSSGSACLGQASR